jgi:hypothetical protein
MAGVLAAMTRLSGLDAPWNELAGAMGVASGMVACAVPAACLFLLGRDHLGHHYGLLVLSFAVGEVVMVPAAPAVTRSPAPVLLGLAAACLVVAALALWVRPPAPPRPEPPEPTAR